MLSRFKISTLHKFGKADKTKDQDFESLKVGGIREVVWGNGGGVSRVNEIWIYSRGMDGGDEK